MIERMGGGVVVVGGHFLGRWWITFTFTNNNRDTGVTIVMMPPDILDTDMGTTPNMCTLLWTSDRVNIEDPLYVQLIMQKNIEY